MFPGLMKNAEAGIQPQRKEILQYARQQNSVRIVEEVIKPLLMTSSAKIGVCPCIRKYAPEQAGALCFPRRLFRHGHSLQLRNGGMMRIPYLRQRRLIPTLGIQSLLPEAVPQTGRHIRQMS